MDHPERKRQSTEVTEAVRKARDEFLAADDGYVEAGADRLVIDRLAPYFDPARRRAKVISDYAHGLSVEVAAFDCARASLTERLAILSAALEQSILAIAQAMLAEAMAGAPRIGRLGGAGDEAAAIGERLDALHDLAIRIGHEYAWALRLTKALIELRQAELERYVADVPHLDAKTLFGQFVEIATEEGIWTIGEEFLKEVVVHGVPVVAIAGGVLRVGRGLREKARAMEAHYESGPLDRMFALAEETDDERELIDGIASLLDATLDSFNEITRTANGMVLPVPTSVAEHPPDRDPV